MEDYLDNIQEKVTNIKSFQKYPSNYVYNQLAIEKREISIPDLIS